MNYFFELVSMDMTERGISTCRKSYLRVEKTMKLNDVRHRAVG